MKTFYPFVLPSLVISFLVHDGSGELRTSAADHLLPSKIHAHSADLPPITGRTIHVLVALCDNKYQGIVPVPARIGNGQDPDNNLYWGCGYGIRTFFKKSTEWSLLETMKVDSMILERLLFKHRSKDVYLIADAYDGRHIKECTRDLLNAASGRSRSSIAYNDSAVGILGNAAMLAYIGHDGLMEFELPGSFDNVDFRQRDMIILACYSKRYFSPYLQKSGIDPIVWTTGLMAPEAYTLHDALSGYVNGETNESIRTRAASAYSRYQKCSEKAARNLLVTGW